MNPYEAACERFSEASDGYRRAKAEAARMLADANLEYERAEASLREYEESPGIPLPQYREQVPA